MFRIFASGLPAFDIDVHAAIIALGVEQIAQGEQARGLARLPDDYKASLAKCNRGKPTLERFDTERQKECVLDYMVDLEDTVAIAQAIAPDNLIPIATDPFGNLIALKVADRQIESVVFWDHERDEIFKLSSSFTEFLAKLY